MDINDNYITEAPEHANAAKIFDGQWSSRVPGLEAVTGPVPLFEDHRIQWLIDHRGRFDGQKVLELGPLEAGHTSMLVNAGADVLAIEANTLAYLRCLIVKEALDMKTARFLLGDFDKYLQTTPEQFDLILASGVLYHMSDPLRTLQNMMRCADELLIWSHFFDDAAMPTDDIRRRAFTGETYERELEGDTLTYYRQAYQGVEENPLFMGGVFSGSAWIDRNQAIALMESRGYAVTVTHRHDEHPNGPAASLYAKR